MNLSTEKKIMDMENRLMIAKRDGLGTWVKRCRLLSLEWISNEILLCSTGNYVWSLTTEHDMWEKRMYTGMCNWITLLNSRKLTEHYNPTIVKKKIIIYKKKKPRKFTLSPPDLLILLETIFWRMIKPVTLLLRPGWYHLRLFSWAFIQSMDKSCSFYLLMPLKSIFFSSLHAFIYVCMYLFIYFSDAQTGIAQGGLFTWL